MKSQKDKQGQLSVVRQMVRTFPNVVASELLVAASVVLGEYWSLFFLGRFIDFVVSRATLTLLLKELLIFLVGLLGFALLKAIAKAVAASATDDLDAEVTKQMTKSLIDVDYSTFVSSDFRDLYSAAKNGMTFNGGFHSFIEQILLNGFTLGATVIASISALTLLVSKLAFQAGKPVQGLVTIAFLLLVIGFASLASYFSAKAGGKYMTQFYRFNSKLGRTIDYYFDVVFWQHEIGRSIRLYDDNKTITNKARQLLDDQVHEDQRLQVLSSKVKGLGTIVVNVGIGLMYAVIALAGYLHQISIGQVVAYVGYLSAVVTALGQFMGAYGRKDSALETISQYFKFTAFQKAGTQSQALKGQVKQMSPFATIVFDDVSFRYPGAAQDAISHVSFTLDSGVHMALVGKNGSGKSTLIKLLLRLEKPTSGRITMDGVDIATLPNYEAYFSCVFQKTVQYAVSLKENIMLNLPDDEGRLQQAIDFAGLTALVAKLPAGVDTSLTKYVDEEGVELSGGEAQKLCIARAWYRGAMINVMDEPTSALDPHAETEIFQKLSTLSKQQTALLVSHRMGFARDCDRILVLDHGRLVESGAHATLMSEKGQYFQLFSAQAGLYT